AQEMVRRSGQMGVPVITADGEVVVGFDRPRLEKIAARYAQAGPSGGPKLGLLVRSAAGGLEVGGVRPGSPAERAGVRSGGLGEAVNGPPVRAVEDLERLARASPPGQPVTIGLHRDGRTLNLSLVA